MKRDIQTYGTDNENLALGIALSLIQVAVFFSFIFYCAFIVSPENATLGDGLPLPFIHGLAVIACGALLTALYVIATNRRESRDD